MRKILYVLAGFLLVASPAWAESMAQADSAAAANSDECFRMKAARLARTSCGGFLAPFR